MTRPILRFSEVSFSYPQEQRLVLPGFSLDIPEGSITAVLGPNGAGKTTMLYLALGWLKPQAGSVQLNERYLKDYSRRELGQWIGLVPQTEHIAFDFSLVEYVLLGRAPYLNALEMPGEEDLRIAMQALDRVGLGNLKQRSVLNLSGGERQLLLTARALAQQPHILLMDEPSSHLDLGNKVRLMNLIRELSEQKVSILLTTHEPELASAIATHLVLMRDGKIQDTGLIKDVMTSAKLSDLYGVPINVRDFDGRKVVLWG